MRIGIDLDDVVAECAVPYLRAFAEQYRLELPDEDLGWQTLAQIEEVSGEEKDRFRIALYDGTFFSELEPYADCPDVVERIAAAGHEIYFVTARAERRRVVTETWLREKGLIQHARAVHLKPHGDFDPGVPPGRYDATSSAIYKVRLARELELDAFCEDDVLIARSLAEAGIKVWLFDHVWNRTLAHPNITRVVTWADLATELAV
ncbi:MAG TPA: hypothetical protein VIN69_03060 [Candidatus Limnocylindria bacterium]